VIRISSTILFPATVRLTFQELMGLKRAAYFLYAGDKIIAQMAKEIGLAENSLDGSRRFKSSSLHQPVGFCAALRDPSVVLTTMCGFI